MRIQRVKTDQNGNQIVYTPYEVNGGYVMAKPRAGSSRNLSRNQVMVPSLEEVAQKLKDGYSLRMWAGPGSDWVLIGPRSICVN